VSTEWSIPGAIDAVTDAVPDRDMLVWTSVRRTYADVRRRTQGLAAFFRARGLGVQHERSGLQRWECGQDRVAIVMSNCPEYVETMIGAFRARVVPFNVNHHYHPVEVASLLDQMGANAVVYHRRFGPLLAGSTGESFVLVDVDDGSGVAPRPGSIEYESALAAAGASGDALPAPSPDDVYLMCTGGTTGRPKGVMWRQGDAYVAAMSGADDATRESIASVASGPARVWFPAPPLMHSAAQWTVFSTLHNGGTVVLHDDAGSFDPRTILQTIDREGVQLMTIVGDAYARPLVDELRARCYDLSSLQVLATGGAMTSPDLKRALLECLPNVLIVDGYGASETGGMAFGASQKNAATREFRGADGAAVLSEDRTRFLQPGDDEVGWTARVGRVPLGYLNDRDATERTFPIVDGRRLAVPGDRATISPGGGIVLLGRDSMVINSGGEKIFVEEVEEAVRRHPDVFDAVVVGRPSARFGEEVVALVQLRQGIAAPTGAAIRAFVAAEISRFKAPRAVLFCDTIGRHPSGKADYRWARATALDAVAVGE
jgi:acyl-CoA synthetase (AMP-forming)/AMP-acid ligase II